MVPKKAGAPAAKPSAEPGARRGSGRAPVSSKGSKSGTGPTYVIYFSNLSAVGLPAKDFNGSSDPFLQLELEGEKDKPRTKHLSNTLSPNWHENLELKGSALGNDLLKVTVFDHDMITSDDILGVGELLLRRVPFGVTSTQQVPLVKYTKGKPERKAISGSGGTVKFNINIQPHGKKAIEQPWQVPLYNATVEVLNGKEIPVGDAKRGTTDPLVVLRLNTPNSQKQKTKVRRRSLAPTWNEQKTFLLADYQNDQLKLILFDGAAKEKEEKLSEATIDLKSFQPGDDFVEKEVHLKPVDKYPSGGIVMIRVKIDQVNKPSGESASQSESDPASNEDEEPKMPESTSEEQEPQTRAVEVGPEGPCQWKWVSYNSTYSTNFTGYTDRGPGFSSGLNEAEERFHVHQELVPKEKEDAGTKVKERWTLRGVVRSAEGLMKAETEGAETHVHVGLSRKRRVLNKEEKSKKVKESDAPKYSLSFDFGEVVKGLAVEFTVFQTYEDGEIPIGHARKEVKDIEEGEHSPVEIELSKPAMLMHVPKGFAGPWGKLVVEFDKKLLPEDE